MNFKIVIIALGIFFMNANTFSQMMLSAKIQGKETAKENVEDAPLQLNLEKSAYKNVCNFDIMLSQKNPSSAYKRTIEIADEAGSRLYASDESAGTPGVYHIDLTDICNKVASTKIIQLILLENPANDLMMLPSKMKQIAKIHLK